MDVIRDWWAMILTIAGVIAWSVRLEAKTIWHGKEIERFWDQRDKDSAEIKDLVRGIQRELHDMRRDILDLFKKPRGEE